MRKKLIKTIWLFACLFYINSLCIAQQSSLLISKFSVSNHISKGTEIKKLVIKLDVSNIDLLAEINLELSSDKFFSSPVIHKFGVIQKNGRHFLSYDKNNSLPINGKPEIVFLIEVPNQLVTPCYYFRISGIDINGWRTNTLQYYKK